MEVATANQVQKTYVHTAPTGEQKTYKVRGRGGRRPAAGRRDVPSADDDMTLVFTIAAIIGLLIFIVGAVLHLFTRPYSAMIMVIGALVFAVAEVILLFDVIL